MTSVWIWQIDEDAIDHVQGVYATEALMKAAIEAYIDARWADDTDRDTAPLVGLQAKFDYYEQAFQERPMVWDEWEVEGTDDTGRRTCSCGMAWADEPGHDHTTWPENEDHPVADWQYEVTNKDTSLGYYDWVNQQKGNDE